MSSDLKLDSFPILRKLAYRHLALFFLISTVVLCGLSFVFSDHLEQAVERQRYEMTIDLLNFGGRLEKFLKEHPEVVDLRIVKPGEHLPYAGEGYDQVQAMVGKNFEIPTHVVVTYRLKPFSFFQDNDLLLTLAAFIVALVASYFLQIGTIKILRAKILDPIMKGIPEILNPDSTAKHKGEKGFNEIDLVLSEVRSIYSKYHAVELRKAELNRSAERAKMAAQVAHDIRSPLSALLIALSDLSSLPEDKRVMARNSVNRIRDVANKLLESGRAPSAEAMPGVAEVEERENETAPDDLAPCLLSVIADELVSEKRLLFRDKETLSISFEHEESAYGAFAIVRPREFKRVLSNLLNNAAEALGDRGVVEARVSATDRQVIVEIRDNGKGIAPDVLPKLMQAGATFGKSGGTGLGLYHARETVESLGGKISIESAIGKGTTVTIALRRAPAPVWFVPKLEVRRGSRLVVVDDDSSIHAVWRHRFSTLISSGELGFESFSTQTEFSRWLTTQGADARETLFLVDYEFAGSDVSGLALIERLGLASRSILVTSRTDEASIQRECLRLGVRFIPKSMAPFVPVRLLKLSSEKTAEMAPEATC